MRPPVPWVRRLKPREVKTYQGHREASARLGSEAGSVWLRRSCSCPAPAVPRFKIRKW